jgi:hypothetical protein
VAFRLQTVHAGYPWHSAFLELVTCRYDLSRKQKVEKLEHLQECPKLVSKTLILDLINKIRLQQFAKTCPIWSQISACSRRSQSLILSQYSSETEGTPSFAPFVVPARHCLAPGPPPAPC